MANTRTLTSANAVITITAAGLYPAPVQIQGFATDDIYTTEDQDQVEAVMGADGRLSAGYTPAPIPQVFTLQADSPSVDIFDYIAAQQHANLSAYPLTMAISLIGTGKGYTASRGFLTRLKRLPDAKKILQPIQYRIVWESIDPAIL